MMCRSSSDVIFSRREARRVAGRDARQVQGYTTARGPVVIIIRTTDDVRIDARPSGLSRMLWSEMERDRGGAKEREREGAKKRDDSFYALRPI